MFSINSTIKIPRDVLLRKLKDEAVALDLATGTYYGLDEVATRIWALLAERGSISETIDVLLQEYDAERLELESYVMEFIDQLHSYGLVEVVES